SSVIAAVRSQDPIMRPRQGLRQPQAQMPEIVGVTRELVTNSTALLRCTIKGIIDFESALWHNSVIGVNPNESGQNWHETGTRRSCRCPCSLTLRNSNFGTRRWRTS